MPRPAVQDNNRVSLRVPAEEKAVLVRAAAIKGSDLTSFVREHSLKAAVVVIEEAERVTLSGRDSLRVLDMLENPPKPNKRLLAVAKALSKKT